MFDNVIEMNGVMFYADVPQAYFERNRSKRLQKKLCVGEFLELVLRVDIQHTISEDDEVDKVLDHLLELPIEKKIAISIWEPEKTTIWFTLENIDNSHKEVDIEVENIIKDVEDLFDQYDDSYGISHHIIFGR